MDDRFGFRQWPFAAMPQVEFYFPGEVIENARNTLLRCLQRGEGAAMVVGGSGTGKTLLAAVLAAGLDEVFPVAMLAHGRLSTRRSLLQSILHGLGRPYLGMDEGELRLSLFDYLTYDVDCPNGIVLFVDDAHLLPLRLLEELRLLTNIVRNGQPGLRLVLMGGCQLEERFANPKLDALSQRLVARCYLESLGRIETAGYIRRRITIAGANGEAICSDAACHAVHQATDGIPRAINQVCDYALLLAQHAGRGHLEPSDVEAAWAELQQMPMPSGVESANQGGGGQVIEFGALDDSMDDSLDGGETDDTALTCVELDFEASDTDPADRVDQIEAMLHEAGDDRNADDDHQLDADATEPLFDTDAARTQVELAFDTANPFEESFAEEEAVLDPYAGADSALPTQGPMILRAFTEAARPTEPLPEEPLPEAASAMPIEEAPRVAVATPEPAEAALPAEPIVAEASDAEEEVATLPLRPQTLQRRPEYRRLFARLRQG